MGCRPGEMQLSASPLPTNPGPFRTSNPATERLRPDALASRVENVFEDSTQFLRPARLGLGEILLGVFERVLEHVQPIANRFELAPRHDELVLPEPQLERPPAGLVVALATRPLAVEARSPDAPRLGRELAPAPTTAGLRHSDAF
jgi:hypothetical protein